MRNTTLSGKPAMSSARRDHIHGPLEGVDEQPSYRTCAILGLLASVLLFASLVYVLPEIV